MRDHILIIGGGIAGLLHARVAADFARQVTILDADDIPADAEPRGGVPQGRHIHYLMSGGLQRLEALFPGIETTLSAEGAPRVRVGLDTRYMLYGRWQPQVDAGIYTYVIERPHLEHIIRAQVLELANVRMLTRTEVTGLRLANGRVTGVIARRRPGSVPVDVPEADLVIDTSGRRSRVVDWLQEAGYPPVSVTTLDSQLGYATRWYRKPDGFDEGWRILYVLSAPPHQTRAGAILETRGDRWHVTLGGINGDYPPSTAADYLDFARTLPDPAIYEAIKDAEPLTEVHSYRSTANRWRHFEKVDRLPAGLLVSGDAAVEVNPVYGQGMTKAMINAEVLGEVLHVAGDPDPRLFYRKLAAVNRDIWSIASGGDRAYPGTIANIPETPVERVQRAYTAAVLRTSTTSASHPYNITHDSLRLTCSSKQQQLSV